jgi:hypothetical protein
MRKRMVVTKKTSRRRMMTMKREAETLPKWNGYMPPDFYYYKEGHKKQGQLNLEKAIRAPGYNSLEQHNSCQVVNIFLDQYTGTQEYNEEGCKYLLYMLIGMCARDGWLGMGYFSERGIAKMFYEAKKLYDEAAVEGTEPDYHEPVETYLSEN